MFVGRKRELERLKALRKKQAASLVAVTGRRRIGKSRLLREFGREFKQTYFFSGLPPTEGVGPENQKLDFARRLSDYFNLPKFQSDDWAELFKHLSDRTQRGAVLVVLDEISWMAMGDKLFLPQLKNAWDLEFKNNPKLVLALCGSVSSWITKNILSSTGFVGRVSEMIALKELGLEEANAFWLDKPISARDKLKALSIVGGVPRYLEELLPSETAEQNALRLCFSPQGLLFSEFEQLFSDLFRKKEKSYRKLLKSLTHQHIIREDIVEGAGGSVTARLDELVELGFAKRDYTWHLKDAKQAKLSKYRLSDNYSRFYLKYILPNKRRIEAGSFPDKGLRFLSKWDTIMGLQLENLIINNKQKIFDILGLDKRDVRTDGPFFQTKTSKRAGCQVDYLIQTTYDHLYLCEVKNTSEPLSTKVIKEVECKVQALERTKNFSVRPVLISAGPVNEGIVESRYFDKVIEAEDLLA